MRDRRSISRSSKSMPQCASCARCARRRVNFGRAHKKGVCEYRCVVC
jgi:hypothetical protein